MSMRSNDDFKAEVYKRGREKIQKRRARRRAIISAMSIGAVAACFVLVIFAASPGIKNDNNELKNASEEYKKDFGVENMDEETTTFDYMHSNSTNGIKGEPTNDKYAETIGRSNVLVVQMESDNNKNYINQISDSGQLEKFVEIIAEIEREGLKSDERDTTKVSNSPKKEIYTLKFKYKGIEKEYFLKGNILIISESNTEYVLNNKQLEDLYNIIKK